MDLTLDDDHRMVQGELRRRLGGLDAARAGLRSDGRLDRARWQMLADTGVFAVLSTGDAGLGLGRVGASVVFEELGRAAVVGPLVATALAGTVLAEAAGGAAAVTAAEPPTGAEHLMVVEHLGSADLLMAIGDGGVVVAPSPAPLPERFDRPLDPLTPVWPLAALPPGAGHVGGADVAARFRRDAHLLVAALQVGLGATALDLAVDYAKARRQFGRVIGSFQAIKHLLADVAVSVEVARSALWRAACTIDETGGPCTAEVSAARITASGAAGAATAACVQVHGGIGYTWDLPAHLLLKRSAVLDAGFGSIDAAHDLRAATLAAPG